MACGTGKTFTSLKIAEQFPKENNLILFLVPSISLLSQTLREWTAESDIDFHSITVCSDTKVGKNKRKSKSDDNGDITVNDLVFPPTTNAQDIIESYQKICDNNTQNFNKNENVEMLHEKFLQNQENQAELTVIFSTYKSIQAISEAQKIGLPELDLIICDETHITTGVTIAGTDESYFVKVHNRDFVKAKKRLYMTATPKIYSDNTKVQARENDAFLCSMDDLDIYGQEFHRLGFGEAVSTGLLTDYKVMVLAVDEKFVSATFQQQLADANNELNLDDAVKIVGSWNGLSKRLLKDATGEEIEDNYPMKRAVAFSRSIKDSQKIVKLFADIIHQYQQLNPDDEEFLPKKRV